MRWALRAASTRLIATGQAIEQQIGKNLEIRDGNFVLLFAVLSL